jgi:hypothetical protein
MRAFRSVWRMQIALVTQAPTKQTDISGTAMAEFMWGYRELSRISP